MGTEREKLEAELKEHFAIKADGKTRPLATWGNIAKFIIEDRKRICEPLKGINKVDLTTAEKQILKNAGLE